MNSLSRTLTSRAVAQVSRRSMASNALPPLKKHTFKENWLSDPSTWPIMVIMAGGLTFMVGMGFNALFTYKDVQINPTKRGTMMRDWGEEHHSGVLERFVTAKGGVKAEGLGIDHDEWAKKKDEYKEQ